MLLPIIQTVCAAVLGWSAPQLEATIVFAGDAMQHGKQLQMADAGNGKYDFTKSFTPIKDWVSEADYAVVNLETPLGDGNFSGYPQFNAPVAYAEALKAAGFDLFLLANNHLLDRRAKGLRRTVALLDSLQVDHIGAYSDANYRDKTTPLIKDIKGFKVGMLNYTYGTNGIPITDNVVIDVINNDKMASDIKAIRDAGAELVVVNIHWGEEYMLLPPASVKKIADFLSKQDVDMIIGGHPHVIQPMEVRTNSISGKPQLLVYSMGNLISNMTNPVASRGGAMVKTVIRRDDNGKAYFSTAEYMPHFTVPGKSFQDTYRVIMLPTDDKVDQDIPAEYRSIARQWLDVVIPVFDKNNINVPRATK